MDRLVAEAQKKIQDYQWTAASDLCEQALGLLDALNEAEVAASITEFKAKCEFKAAFQSKNKKDFSSSMGLSVASYESAAALQEKGGWDAQAKRARSKSLFANFWLERDIEARTKILEQCITLCFEAAKIHEVNNDKKSLAETQREVQNYLTEAHLLARESRVFNERFEEAAKVGREAIDAFKELEDDEGLLETLYMTLWLFAVEAQGILEPTKFQELGKETGELWKELEKVSQRIGRPHALCLSKAVAGDIAFDLEGDSTGALNLYKSAASMAEETEDSYLLGRILASMLSATIWSHPKEEYVERRRELIEKGLTLASDAARNLEISGHTTSLSDVYDRYANCYIDLAVLVETEAVKKREHLSKAIEIAKSGTRYENGTWGWRGAAHALSKAMYFMAAIETDPEEKGRLLREALPIRVETLRVTELLIPNSWDVGVMCNYLALIKSELATIEKNPQIKVELLEGAASDMRKCRQRCMKWDSMPSFLPRIAWYCEWYGDIASRLYAVTKNSDVASEAVKAYIDTIEYLKKAGQVGPIPAIRWKIAKLHDLLGDFKLASESFRKADDDYKIAATKIPATSPVFSELADYMRAWARIEDARVHHDEEEYALAFEDYDTAANTLQETNTWGYLSSLCKARSLLEKGEELSREERHLDSKESISIALKTFEQAREDLEDRLRKCEGPKEEDELEEWLKLAIQREAYCRGRVELEEARALDKKGEKAASSRKYRSASETFKDLSIETDSTQERGELETLAQFCEAWARMKEAELKASPELYSEAARSFMEAKETTSKERFRFLALANASVCKALEAGTEFRLTRNTRLYSEIKKHLETAADYYQEAGLEKTGSWTRATQRMFDALVYMAEAETEKEPNKRTEFYHLAEKHLELAAKLYEEAGFPSKREEALHHLDRAREEKEILLATVQAIAEIPTVSGTSITSLSLTRGQPLGLERFEEANVIGNMSVPQRNLQVGSDFTFELEMANVGKAASTLVKLENVVPDGFEIEGEKNPYRIEDRHINLRGKRLDHLKMHEMKITLKPVRRGSFQLRPRILYVDDKGSYKSRDFPPVLLSVQELGIRGWLRGPGRQKTPQEPTLEPSRLEEPHLVPSPLLAVPAELSPEFHFGTERARDVFQHLVKEFLKDYMSRRLYVEKAGWRSLMDLVRETKIPRSAVYGPSGRSGPVLQELERRGLIENRIFPEEPGRGGKITKVRVAYDNDVVKRIVDRTAMDSA